MEITNLDVQPYRVVFRRAKRGKDVAVVELVVLPDLFGQRPAAYIHKVYVDDAYQGMGIGASLVNEALAKAKEIGCYKVFTICKDDVLPFYERFGLNKDQLALRKAL